MHILRLANKLESVNIVNFFGVLFLDVIFIFAILGLLFI
jgi:hypothetical protein